MRIEFYKTSDRPDEMQWDLTHQFTSLWTGEKIAWRDPSPGTFLCRVAGFYLEPGRLEKAPDLAVPATPDQALSWLRRAGYLSPWAWWRARRGGADALLAECRARPKHFPELLMQMTRNKTVRRAVRARGGDAGAWAERARDVSNNAYHEYALPTVEAD